MELERARAHLRNRQALLRTVRRAGHSGSILMAEEAVLAALSWLWEAQENERICRAAEWQQIGTWTREGLLVELRQIIDGKGYLKATKLLKFFPAVSA